MFDRKVAPGGKSGLVIYDSKGRGYDEEALAAIREELERRVHTDGIAIFTRSEVQEAYLTLRAHNHTIPSECLEEMRAMLLASARPD